MLQMSLKRIDKTPHGVVGGARAFDPRHERIGGTYSSGPGKDVLIWPLDIEGRSVDCDHEFMTAVEEAGLL